MDAHPVPHRRGGRPPTICAILISIGLEVRIVKIKATARGSAKKYVEFRPLSEVDHEL